MNKELTVAELKEMLDKKPDVDEFQKIVTENIEVVPLLLDIIREDKGSIKFFCEKIIRLISETEPKLIYPYFDDISRFIDSKNSFIKWGGLITLSNLAAVDDKNKFKGIYEKYFSMIDSESMITAGNVVGNAWKIIMKNPEYEGDITKRLLGVTDNTYVNKGKPSAECRNIMLGNVIDCFEKYYPISEHKREMMEFAAGQRNNTRKSVAKRAEKFIEEHQK
ncbi:MAG: hypothetical protein HGA49_01715 [Eubacteriaceae bacterium]|nr:hypothetical protein [Eubacteriaceae bacterium]